MVVTEDVLENFNEYCYNIQIEFNRLEYTDRTSNFWTDKRMSKYRFGIVPGLFDDEDPKITEMLKYHYDRKMLYCLVGLYFNRQKLKNKKLCKNFGKPELYKQETFKLSINGDIYDWAKNYNYLYFEPVKDRPKDVQLMFLLLQLSYDKYYDERINHIEIDQPNLKNIVNNNNYNLIDINENAIQIPEICNRVYIKSINKTVFCSVDNRFAKILYDLKESGYISKLAFRGKNDYVFDGKVTTAPLCERVKRGLLLNWDIVKLHKITKLYNDDNYSENMWINVLDNDMTFEEMSDAELKQDNNIVTNVIHVIFYKKDNDYFISHMDHEYIFYDTEEYEKKKKQYSQKGHKRIKTFKIDDSSVPMNYLCQIYNNNGERVAVPFLYYVLNLYFNNKKLVQEYFSIIS